MIAAQLWPKNSVTHQGKKRQKNVSKLAGTYSNVAFFPLWCGVKISSVIASQKTKTFFFYSLLWSCSFCFLSIRFNGQLALDWRNTCEKMLLSFDQEILEVLPLLLKCGKRTHDNITFYAHPVIMC